MDMNVYQANMFHTKMLIRNIDLDNYLFHTTAADMSIEKQQQIRDTLRKEMIEIYNGMNIYSYL